MPSIVLELAQLLRTGGPSHKNESEADAENSKNAENDENEEKRE